MPHSEKNAPASTFSKQDSLSHLPVPNISDTCQRFLEWVEPLLTAEELETSKQNIREFLRNGGDGEKLQEKLLYWSRKPGLSNWLEPFWYDTYFQNDKPLPINSNFFYLCDHIPAYADFTQTQKAAALITSLLEFKQLIAAGRLSIDEEQGKPMCMLQYKFLFSTTRIPCKTGDYLYSESLEENKNESARHIVISYRDRFFELEVISASGKLAATEEIEVSLRKIMEIVQEENRKGEGIGLLTTLPRNIWADARKTLLGVSPGNKQALSLIEKAMFTVSLEDAAPETILETSRFFMHSDGGNRWYDKSFQLIVCANGTAGLNAEHSGIDGSPTRRMLGYITEGNINPTWEESYNACEMREISFDTENKVSTLVHRAKTSFDTFIEDTHIRVLEFTNFGKERIKSLQVSPDAFVQLSFQVTQYKVLGRIESTYEAVMTRQFLHGRTEAMRPVTSESVRFAKYMAFEDADEEILATLMKKAAKKHISRILECKSGTGVERHFLGLRKIFDMYGEEIGVDSLPSIFEDPGWKKMTHSMLATSTSDPRGMFLAGYGPTVESGFGVRYVIKNDRLNFNLSSRLAQKDKLDTFTEKLEETLNEMSDLLENVNRKTSQIVANILEDG